MTLLSRWNEPVVESGAVQNLANSRQYNLDISGNASSVRRDRMAENESKFEAVNAIDGNVTEFADDSYR